MLYWAAVFFLIAIISAMFGFGGVASTAGAMAKVLFYLFVVLFVVSLVAGVGRRGRLP